MHATTQDVTVVFVAYNSSRILPDVLNLLHELPHIVVVDNGSSDDLAVRLREQFPHVRLIQSEFNRGFGRANNLALEQITTPYALLLNPDCLLDTAALQHLLDASGRYPEAAILAPKLFDSSGSIGRCYGPSFLSRVRSEILEPQGDLCSEFLTGAAMLLRMDLMRAVGYFDPWFFLYYEDDDLCMRARQAGHTLVLVNQATATHRVKQSSTPSLRNAFRRDYCQTLSKFYITRKYRGALRAWLTCGRILLGSLLALPIHLLFFNRRRLTTTLARLAAALTAPRELSARHCLVHHN